jgi:hypothetical protein
MLIAVIFLAAVDLTTGACYIAGAKRTDSFQLSQPI